MSLTARQIAAIRRRRREDADGAAEDRWNQRVGDVMGLGFAEPITPTVQVGWMEQGHVGGGFVYCLDCCPPRPTVGHVPVYQESHFATKCCVVCGRRLDQSRA